MAIYHDNVPEDIVLDLIELLPPKSKVLDLGCGIGRNAIPLARAGHHVEGREKDAEEIRVLRNLAAAEGVAVETVCTDMRNLRIGYRTWNAVLAILSLHLVPMEDGRHLLKNIEINVLPGGYVALVMLTLKGDLKKHFGANFYPAVEEVEKKFTAWETIFRKVDVVSCKTKEITSGLENERLTLLARKPL